MKSEGHPEYNFIEVVMTDGTRYKTRSTMASKELHLEIDPTSHPAWTGEGHKIRDKGRVSKFNDKFKGFFKK